MTVCGRGVSKILSTNEEVNEAYITKQSVGAQGLPALEELLYPSASQDSLLIASDKEKRLPSSNRN